MRTPTPHDALFKSTFSQPEHAASLLKSVVPKQLLRRLDLSTLERVPGSFVGPALKERHTDLLFKGRLQGREVLLYVLLEHQSTVDRMMPFRVLAYLVRIWDSYLLAHPEATSLPAILPVVVFHGKAGWSAPVEVQQLLDLGERDRKTFGKYLPQLSFLLDDLSALTPEQLQRREGTVGRLITEALLVRGRGAERLEDILAAPLELFSRLLEQPGRQAALLTFLSYLLQVAELRSATLEHFVQQLGPSAEEAYMTTAEQLRREGEARGIAKGRAEGRAETLLQQLRLKFGRLPKSVQSRVLGADVHTLDRWTAAILTASSLDEALR